MSAKFERSAPKYRLLLAPSHVLATALRSAGQDTAYLRADAIKALLP